MTPENDSPVTPQSDEDKAVYQRAGKRTTNALSGQSIPIPPLFILMTRNAAAAVILRQSIYLTTSSEADGDGWFCVPYETWETDYGLTKDIIRGAINGGKKTTGLLQLGLETDVRKERRGNWQSSAPKNHYRINFDKLELAITEFESGKFRQSEKQTKQDSRKSRPSTYKKKKEKTLSPNGNGEGEESLNTKYKNALMVKGVGIGLDNPEARNHWWYISPIAAWLEGKDKPSHSRARDAELIPGCHEPPSLEELSVFLEFWREKGLNMPESVGTFSKEFGKWRIANGFISHADPRASEQWQANAQLYDAFAEAFKDRWTDAEVLALDFSGIESWWFHTGQYEQGSSDE